ERQGKAAALVETITPAKLEGARRLAAPFVNKADFGRGAAHVKRNALTEAVLGGNAGGKDRAARRAGFDEPHREADRGVGRGDAATGRHQQQRASKTRLCQAALKSRDIASHERLKIAIGATRREPLLLPHLPRYAPFNH